MMTRLALAKRKLASAWRLGGRRGLLVFEAASLVMMARVAVALLPFRHVARWLGEPMAPSQLPETASRDSPDDMASLVSWAVRFAAARLPRAVCLPQAIAARAMLRRRGIACRLHLGVARDHAAALIDNPLADPAHAWVEASGQRITGYPVGDDMIEVACFV